MLSAFVMTLIERNLSPRIWRRDLRRRRAGIENDGLAVLDEGRSRSGDSHLLRVVQGLLDGDRQFLAFAGRQCAAVNAHEGTGVGERSEIRTDRDRRDFKAAREFGDAALGLRADERANAAPAFLHRETADAVFRAFPFGGHVGLAIHLDTGIRNFRFSSLSEN